MRGRHGRLHRPDGDAFEPRSRRNGRVVPARGKGVPHRLALRRVREIRYSAPSQSGREERGYRRLHFSGGRRPDRIGFGAGQAHQGQSSLFRRPALLYQGAQKSLSDHVASRRRARRVSRQRALFHVRRRGALFRKRGRAGYRNDHPQDRERKDERRDRNGRTAVCRPRRIRRIRRAPQAERSSILRYQDLYGRRVSRHRQRFHDHETHADHARLQNFILALPVQQRTAARHRPGTLARDLRSVGRTCAHMRLRGHGLRRGYDESGFKGGFRHRGNGGAFQGRRVFQSRRRFHHRYRRTGYQMFQDQKPRHRRHHAQRGVFFGLRFLYPDVRQSHGHGDRRVFQTRPVFQKARRTRLALHGVHEQFGQAGAERGRERGGYLRGAFDVHRQKRHL